MKIWKNQTTSKDSKAKKYLFKKTRKFPCTNGTLRLLGRPRPSSTAQGNPEREDDVDIEEDDQKGSKTEDSWSTRDNLFYRHHEELRLELYDPDNEPFPIHLKYVVVLTQTQTSINNVSINDIRTEAKGVNLSEEWTGILRFQILRTRLPEGYKWVNGRPTKIQETTRPDGKNGLKLGREYPRHKRKNHCRMGRRKRQAASSTPQQRNLRGTDR